MRVEILHRIHPTVPPLIFQKEAQLRIYLQVQYIGNVVAAILQRQRSQSISVQILSTIAQLYEKSHL